MNYTPFLISDFSTGFDQERQPWLLPIDAQFELLDGYVYRGVWRKRSGYSQLATGERGGTSYTESRMIHTVTDEAYGTGDGTEGPYTHTLADTPVSRGSVVITDGTQTATDDGEGGFTTSPAGGSGTIDYDTGDASITFFNTVAGATPITVTYDAFNGLPVMGVMSFFTQTNSRELIVADTKYVNKYDAATNRLVDISPTTLFTGDETQFFSWTNYPTPEADQRLVFVNDNDEIHQYSGGTVTPFPVYTESTAISGAASGVVGDGTMGPYTLSTPANTGIVPGTLQIDTLLPAPQTVTDDQFGNLQGDGTGTVDYLTGDITVTFNANVQAADPILLTYTQLNTPLQTCLHVRQMKDRLLLLSTIENGGTRRGLRVRISGTGAFGDVFTIDAIGAGFFDIPDNTYIQACDFNRDDLLVFTEASLWVIRYTGSDVVPFSVDRIDESRGSQAPYGTITYLNRTSAASPRGLILSDGYSVIRADEKVPNYSFNDIDQDRFAQCFAGSVDAVRDHYLIHPSPGQTISDRILVTNYEEDNYAVYRIPLSCMGNFIRSYDVTWNDLLIYNNWDELAAFYSDWNSFAYTQGAPFSVGGGHEGQIFQLNVVESQDYPVKIRDMTVIDSETLRVTTDFQNFVAGDIISFTGVTGMLEINNKQATINAIQTDNYVFDVEINTSELNSYTDGGTASKVIVFQTKTKKFNPFSEQNQKVRCGWVYFYVSTAGTSLTDNTYITDVQNTSPCLVEIPGHGYSTGTRVYINAVGGTTELNGKYYYITVVDDDTFTLDGIDATGYGVYTSGGFASTPTDATLQVRVIVNDTEQSTQVNPFNPAPYQINLTSQQAENGIKKWYKLYVNQVGRFIQLEFFNDQAGANVEVHAIMPGMAGIGRMI